MSIAIICNKIDHSSLAAAGVMSLACQAGKLEHVLYDVRDAVNLSHDEYYWVAAGTPEQFVKQVKHRDKKEALGYDKPDLKGLKDVVERSVVINGPSMVRVEDLDLSLVRVAYRALIERHQDCHAVLPDTVDRIAALSNDFYSSSIPVGDIVSYLGFLRRSWGAVSVGDKLSPIDAIMDRYNPLGNDTQEKVYSSYQQALSSKMGQLMRSAKCGEHTVAVFTLSDFNAILVVRRFMIAERAVIHRSMGAYGVVTWSPWSFGKGLGAWGEDLYIESNRTLYKRGEPEPETQENLELGFKTASTYGDRSHVCFVSNEPTTA